jgi:hypothetical protein
MGLPAVFRHVAFFAAAALVSAVACKVESQQEKEIKDLTARTAELDGLVRQNRLAGAQQSAQLREAGVGGVRPDFETGQLTPEQKAVLEKRVREEKDNSTRGLIQEVLDRDKEIDGLNKKIEGMRNVLPKPDVAAGSDSHYGFAMRFLRGKKVSEETARRLVSRVFLMDRLMHGFEVYHFYSNGVYGTWVAQGSAPVSPAEMLAMERQRLEGERDAATSLAERLQEDVYDLTGQKALLESEVEELRDTKDRLIDETSALSATNESQKARLNSLHYLVGGRRALEKDGVIIVPVFAKDRAGKNWRDGLFTRSLDLRTEDTIEIAAKDAGLGAIGRLTVIPGSYAKGTHYSVTISEDRLTASIKILTKDRFRNDKVVFALSE